MPDQPADPIHYDMKIPPEPKDDAERDAEQKHSDAERKTLAAEQRGSDEVTAESNQIQRGGSPGGAQDRR